MLLNSEPVWDEFLIWERIASGIHQAVTLGDWHGAIVSTDNPEHPALPTILMVIALGIKSTLGLSVDSLFVVRLPGLVLGALTAPMGYFLGKRTFGKYPALMAALIIALSPWMIFWSAMAYHDIFLVFFVSLSLLLSPLAARNKRYRLPLTASMALAFSSKFTAILFFPAIFLTLLIWNDHGLRRGRAWVRRMAEGKLSLPFPKPAFFLGVLLYLVAFCFLVVLSNPCTWLNPNCLTTAMQNGVERVMDGHQGFYAGKALYWTPLWIPVFILFAKSSLVVFIPGILDVILALALLVQRKGDIKITTSAVWLVAGLGALSTLRSMNDTHYVLPAYPALAFAAATFVQWVYESQLRIKAPPLPDRVRAIGPVTLVLVLLLPNVFGLITVPHGEGFVSEAVQDGDWASTMPYFGYLQAVDYLQARDPGAKVLAVLKWTEVSLNWAIMYRGYHFTVTPYEKGNTSYDYVILCSWSVQVHPIAGDRYSLEDVEGYRLISRISEGKTTFSYILGRSNIVTQ